ncbi:MAG: hypothetical protein JXR77_12795 [Lentisphaeria bacterium]|nr:hypothetical protein [Lentisphaeria bacterium]
MKAFAAIVRQTVRSAVRSHVFHVLGGLILLAVFLLPVTVSGDGTAMGQLQISLTYSLGVVVALISTTTLWLSCALLSRDIESYNLHMVTTKPCPRWLIWLSKWFGVFAMHVAILAVAAAVILALVLWKVSHSGFSPEELARLRREVMIGRRVYQADQPDFADLTEKEYQRRSAEFDQGHDPKTVKAEIRRQLVAKSGEIPPGGRQRWVFRGVRLLDPGEPFYLRFRYYPGSAAQTAQKEMPGMWVIRDPKASVERDVYVPFPLKALTGAFHELAVDPRFIGEDGTMIIGYFNPPPEAQEWGSLKPESAVFQVADGPTLLVSVIGFPANYMRSVFLAIFQIGFLAALGSMVGAAFSTPVAAFVAISYLVIGMAVRAAVDAPIRDEFGNVEYRSTMEMIGHRFAQSLGTVVVSVHDLDATSDLARGRLIEWTRIGKDLFGLILLRGGLIAALGMWVLSRRELGTVIRR